MSWRSSSSPFSGRRSCYHAIISPPLFLWGRNIVILSFFLICAVRFHRLLWAQADYLTSVSLEIPTAPEFTKHTQIRPLQQHNSLGNSHNDVDVDVVSHWNNDTIFIRSNGTPTAATVTNSSNKNGPLQLSPSQLLSPPPRDHPHAGARFPNGSWGYVVNVTRIRKWMLEQYFGHQQKYNQAQGVTGNHPPIEFYKNHTKILPPRSYLPMTTEKELEMLCNVPPKMGSEKRAGWRLLANKISVVDDGKNHSSNSYVNQGRQGPQSTTSIPLQQQVRSKLLCVVYTYEKKHSQVRAIAETWGWRCDGFFAASTQTIEDPTNIGYGSIDLPHEGREQYQNMWRKTRSIWAYIHDYFLSDFDYFYLSGDDTHVIVENLRYLLDGLPQPQAQDQPLYLGHWVPDKTSKSGYFCGGGPGYLLNRQAVRILVQNVLPVCHVHTDESAEDRLLGECFSSWGITGNHSVDSFGAQRFHGMHPNFVASYMGDGKPYFQSMYKFWGNQYGYKTGMALVSNYSVSFHLLKSPEMMKRHHAIIYKSCPQDTVLGDYFLTGRNDSSVK